MVCWEETLKLIKYHCEHEKENRRKASRLWGKNNRLKTAELLRHWQTKRMAWFNTLKKGKVCKYCGESETICLDFHHRNPNEKDSLIQKMVRYTSNNDKVLKEISKCDVVCSNCHRKIHFLGMH